MGRYVPFFFGALAIPLLGMLSRQIKNNNSYLLTILLISINIYLINYSQETRYYSFIFLISINFSIKYFINFFKGLFGSNNYFNFKKNKLNEEISNIYKSETKTSETLVQEDLPFNTNLSETKNISKKFKLPSIDFNIYGGSFAGI